MQHIKHLLSFTLFGKVYIGRSASLFRDRTGSSSHSARCNMSEFVAEVNGRTGRCNRGYRNRYPNPIQLSTARGEELVVYVRV